MLTDKQQSLYDAFYQSTHDNQHLDEKTELLIGLSAAMAMNCAPCTRYYLEKARRTGISKGEIAEVLAKVMAVAAGQKRLQLADIVERHEIDLEKFA